MKKVLQRLNKDSLFKDWIKQHSQAFLSHFFCRLNSKIEPNGDWEIGYINPETNKVTVFVMSEKIEIKPEDDIFLKGKTAIDQLDLKNFKIELEQARKTFQENYLQFFPGANIGDGFLILQSIDKRMLWNFTFIDKSLKFLNLKIDAGTGELCSHEEINLVQKNK